MTGETTYEKPQDLMTPQEVIYYENFLEHKKKGEEFICPAPGERVRLILKGQAFGNWIEARKKHRNNTLQVGDVIMTGTPEGVGYAMQPPQTMKAGDVMELTIEGIGTLTNTISD
jgi:hypothetical protein